MLSGANHTRSSVACMWKRQGSHATYILCYGFKRFICEACVTIMRHPSFRCMCKKTSSIKAFEHAHGREIHTSLLLGSNISKNKAQWSGSKIILSYVISDSIPCISIFKMEWFLIFCALIVLYWYSMLKSQMEIHGGTGDRDTER
jgi:hypothetical protein